MYSLNDRGVTRSNSEPIQRVGPRSLANCAPMQMYGIQYGDASGKLHVAVVVKIGDQWYMPPNAEAWAGQLQPLTPWLTKLLEADTAKKEVKDTSVPKMDSVNIMEDGQDAKTTT